MVMSCHPDSSALSTRFPPRARPSRQPGTGPPARTISPSFVEESVSSRGVPPQAGQSLPRGGAKRRRGGRDLVPKPVSANLTEPRDCFVAPLLEVTGMALRQMAHWNPTDKPDVAFQVVRASIAGVRRSRFDVSRADRAGRHDRLSEVPDRERPPVFSEPRAPPRTPTAAGPARRRTVRSGGRCRRRWFRRTRRGRTSWRETRAGRSPETLAFPGPRLSPA
jgi:hypothetical protein